MRYGFSTLILALAAAMSAAFVFAAPNNASNVPAAAPSAYDAATTGMVDRFLAQPNKENFAALQNRLAADRKFDRSSRGLTEMLDLYKRKQYRQALERFQAAMPDLLLSPQAHFYAARCHEELGQKDRQKAEMAFTRACLQGLMATGDGTPEHPIVVTHMSDEYDLLAAPLQTESKSQSLVEKNDRAYDVLQCANGKTYWFDVTLSFAHSGPADGTTGTAAANTKPAANSPAPQPAAKSARVAPIKSRSAAAEAAYNRGLAALAQHDYDRGVTELNEAIRLDPLNADAFFERGFAYVQKRNFADAYPDLSDAIRLRPYSSQAFYERGLCLRLEGDKARRDDAIADFSEAIRLEPEVNYYWRNRAMVWFAKENYRNAIADDGESIRLKSDDALSYSNRGYAYETLGEFARAIDDFDHAIRLRPQFAEAFAGRGFAFLGQGKFDPAISDLSAAVNLKPDYADAYAFRSLAFARKGQAEYARADAERAAALAKKL